MEAKHQEIRQNGAWKMFDRIAPTYDRLNRVLSLGIDTSWRRKLARLAPKRDVRDYLDIATGTGDQLFTTVNELYNVDRAVGVDMSEGMLAIARQKAAKRNSQARFEVGDAESLPFADESFDLVTVSFGIRNVDNVALGLAEILRVLRPGGHALILETGLPQSKMLRAPYLAYFRHVLPRIGSLVSGDKAAYRYLNSTSEDFPCGDAFCQVARDAGFAEVNHHPLTFGIAYAYAASKGHGQ